MQQTEIDRWLRKKFVYIHRVYCNTLPKKVPFSVNVEEAPEESGGRYLYKLSTRSEKLVREVAEELSKENITFTTRVEDRKVWYAKFLNDPHHSFTYRAAWILIALFCGIIIKSGLPVMFWNYISSEPEEEVPALSESVGGGDNDARIFEVKDTMIEIDRLKQ